MRRRILLALVVCMWCTRLSIQTMPSTMAGLGAGYGAQPQRTHKQNLQVPCNMLSTLSGGKGVIQVSSVRNVRGQHMCTVPADQMAPTMDEMIEKDEAISAAYAGTSMPCKGVLLNRDMCLTPRQNEILKQYHTVDNFHSGRWKRKALNTMTSRWTNNVIPYEIAEGIFSASDIAVIEDSMREWERGTCLTFRRASASDVDKVAIQSGTGCYSRIGRVGGKQELSLGSGICRSKKVILHELGHAIGLIHEHQRGDRDNYVTIMTENVNPQFLDQFNIISPSIVDVSSTKYDYYSLMHYGKSFFSTDGQSVTIRTNDLNYQDVIGRVDKLSFSDFKAVNLMYSCSEGCPQNLYCVDGGYIGPNCQCVCPDGTTYCSATTRPTQVSQERNTPAPQTNVLDPWNNVFQEQEDVVFPPSPNTPYESLLNILFDKPKGKRRTGTDSPSVDRTLSVRNNYRYLSVSNGLASAGSRRSGNSPQAPGNKYPSKVYNHGHANSNFRVIDQHINGRTKIVQLSASNVSAAIEAIKKSQLPSHDGMSAPNLSIGQALRIDSLTQSRRNPGILVLRDSRPVLRVPNQPATTIQDERNSGSLLTLLRSASRNGMKGKTLSQRRQTETSVPTSGSRLVIPVSGQILMAQSLPRGAIANDAQGGTNSAPQSSLVSGTRLAIPVDAQILTGQTLPEGGILVRGQILPEQPVYGGTAASRRVPSSQFVSV